MIDYTGNVSDFAFIMRLMLYKREGTEEKQK